MIFLLKRWEKLHSPSGTVKFDHLHSSFREQTFSTVKSWVGTTSSWHFPTVQQYNDWLLMQLHIVVNPFTPESDQCQNSPAASQEIWHHTVWRTWLFIAYSDEKWLYYKFSLHHSYNRFLKGWENTLFELRSEMVNKSDNRENHSVWLQTKSDSTQFYFHKIWVIIECGANSATLLTNSCASPPSSRITTKFAVSGPLLWRRKERILSVP